MAMTSKERALSIITGKPVDMVPAFSGFGNVIVAGLEKYNLRFAHVHLDAQEMADAAAATRRAGRYRVCDRAVRHGRHGRGPGRDAEHLPALRGHPLPTLRDKYVHEAADIKMPRRHGRAPDGCRWSCEAIRKLKERFGGRRGRRLLGPRSLHAGGPEHGPQRDPQDDPQGAGEGGRSILEKLTEALDRRGQILHRRRRGLHRRARDGRHVATCCRRGPSRSSSRILRRRSSRPGTCRRCTTSAATPT